MQCSYVKLCQGFIMNFVVIFLTHYSKLQCAVPIPALTFYTLYKVIHLHLYIPANIRTKNHLLCTVMWYSESSCS